MCSPDEMGKIAPIVRDCTCLSSIVIMDRSGPGSLLSSLYQHAHQNVAVTRITEDSCPFCMRVFMHGILSLLPQRTGINWEDFLISWCMNIVYTCQGRVLHVQHKR